MKTILALLLLCPMVWGQKQSNPKLPDGGTYEPYYADGYRADIEHDVQDRPTLTADTLPLGDISTYSPGPCDSSFRYDRKRGLCLLDFTFVGMHLACRVVKHSRIEQQFECSYKPKSNRQGAESKP